MIRENCSKIGFFSKPHGIEGGLILRLEGNFADEIEPGEPLFVEIDKTLVPFFIEEITPFDDKAIVKLEFVPSKETAQRYVSKNVFARIDISPVFLEKQATRYISFSIIDMNTGIEGIITGYSASNMNPTFVVKSGNNEFLIPVSAEYIEEVLVGEKKLIMKLPEGLLEL